MCAGACSYVASPKGISDWCHNVDSQCMYSPHNNISMRKAQTNTWEPSCWRRWWYRGNIHAYLYTHTHLMALNNLVSVETLLDLMQSDCCSSLSRAVLTVARSFLCCAVIHNDVPFSPFGYEVFFSLQWYFFIGNLKVFLEVQWCYNILLFNAIPHAALQSLFFDWWLFL